MKKLCLFLAVILFISCSKSDDDGGTPEPQNQFKGTSWVSDDPIMIILYGKGSTRTIEFLTDTTCQEISFILSGPMAGTKAKKGTYTHNGDNVVWTVDGKTTTAKRSGSLLETTVVIENKPIVFRLIK